MERDPKKCISAKALLDEGVSHSGFVVKEGGRFRSMHTRYFILHEGCIYYYKDFKSCKEQGSFCVLGYEVKEDISQDDVYGIRLVPPCPNKRPYYFVVPTENERKEWVEKLNKEIGRISGDGCDGEIPQDYDYAYQKMNTKEAEEQHDYEDTDLIPTIQPSRNGTPYSPQKKLSNSSTLPANTPPPSVPAREKLPTRRASDRGPPRPGGGFTKSNRMPPLPNPNTKPKLPGVPPKPPISAKPSIPKKAPIPPQVSKKPGSMSPGSVSRKKDNTKQLEMKLKQKGPNARERYEIQELKGGKKDTWQVDESESSGSESDSYLDLDEQGFDANRKPIERSRPTGCSAKKEFEEKYIKAIKIKADDPDEKLLPLSVFQESLTRETAECILNGIAKDGMYLIRLGRTGKQVVTVYTGKDVKHYQIFEQEGMKYLKDGEPRFKTLANLVRHYFTSQLPTCPNNLTTPYS